MKRSWLWWGMVAGPFYLIVALMQAFVRDGFDLGRHSVSALANGSGGWIQTANFSLTGVMVLAAAIGLARTVGSASKIPGWALGVFGASMLAAAVFPADPADGFPPGTPSGMPTTISTPGMMHFAVGVLGFLALAAACFGTWRALSKRADVWPARLSLLAALAIIAGFFAPAFVPAVGPVGGIWFSVLVGWTWLAAISWHLSRGDSARGAPAPHVE